VNYDPNDLNRPPKVLERLGAPSKSTLYGWIQEGKFPRPHKMGRMAVWTNQQIEDGRRALLEGEAA